MKVADMFERNGRMSHTKTLMMIGGLTSSWAIIYVTLHGTLSADMLGVYIGALVIGTIGSKGVSSYDNYKSKEIDAKWSSKAKPDDDDDAPYTKGAKAQW
jgi:hypothetical protein